MNIEIKKNNMGKDICFAKFPHKKGIEWLKHMGWETCDNKEYFRNPKNGNYAHYNRVVKAWIFEA